MNDRNFILKTEKTIAPPKWSSSNRRDQFYKMPSHYIYIYNGIIGRKGYKIAASYISCQLLFYISVNNINADDALHGLNTVKDKVWNKDVYGATSKIFVLDNLRYQSFFLRIEMLIATHCERRENHQRNLEETLSEAGELTATYHHNGKLYYQSSQYAVELAKYNSDCMFCVASKRVATLFSNEMPLKKKRITAEKFVPHHLHFTAVDYAVTKGYHQM